VDATGFATMTKSAKMLVLAKVVVKTTDGRNAAFGFCDEFATCSQFDDFAIAAVNNRVRIKKMVA